jgi:preprotein translocase subunit SecA
MSRAALAGWGCRVGADWLAPEREAARQGALDRWLAGCGARIGLLLGGFERMRLRRFAARVVREADGLRAVSDAQLSVRAQALRVLLHRHGITAALAVRAFALGSEASARLLGKRPYPVQLMGGYGLLRGRLVEMATGEGKTLTALLPSLTLALAGIPVHVITVNDYLARRDADYVRPVLNRFGFSVGVVTHLEEDHEKRIAYLSDVTYCVNKDVVFDYLRDSLKPRPSGGGPREARCQRGLYFALVDEADSILVDEARTPLVIARERPPDQERIDATLALQLAHALKESHFKAEQEGRQYKLTNEGRFFLRAQEQLLEQAPPTWRLAKVREERVEQALCALHTFRRGAHYVIQDGKVQIVDEFTGRILPDRSWERGLHQMIELKEQLEVSAPRETIAKQTYPEFFSRYLRIAGMTGTGSEVAGEIKANFGMQIVKIPTNRPRRLAFLGVRLFADSAQRWEAIAQRARTLAQEGRAVLIGTRSVLASEELSAVLERLGQPHRVLNALQDHLEAEIIGQAGQAGCVTVATNMAGRGTDIDLDPQVRDAGGLHVILSEFHESRRIDRQLYGRAGRQGDPGSCEAILSLDDELFVQFGALPVRWLRRVYPRRTELPAYWGKLLRIVAQARAERNNAGVRRNAAERDTAMRRSMAFTGANE